MSEKKKPGRFTIQFNMRDPGQAAVSELLERQGRHKAQFLTNAVQHYLGCPQIPETPTAGMQLLDKSQLEDLVMEILVRRGEIRQGSEDQTMTDREVQQEQSTELEQILGKSGLSAIASTLSAFQRG